MKERNTIYLLNMNELPDETNYRFVAVLNKKIEVGRLMNALGHMTAGLIGGYPNINDLQFLQYMDADNNVHPNISHYPFIVLKADNSNQIRTVRNKIKERHMPFTDFTSTMTVGTSQEQQDETKNTPEIELEYWGICTFGETAILREFTKRFQLFRV